MKKKTIVNIVFALILTLFLFNNVKSQDLEKIDFEYVSGDSIGPCLWYYEWELVIKDIYDYDSILGIYGHPAYLEDFVGDGITKSFLTKSKLRDINSDDKISISDLLIYYDGEINVSYNKRKYRVNSYPFHFDEDENILIYTKEYPRKIIARIPSNLVLTVAPENGLITFNTPPQKGTKIRLTSSEIYDSPRCDECICSMDDFDFSNKILVGKKIDGNGCLHTFTIDRLNKDSKSH